MAELLHLQAREEGATAVQAAWRGRAARTEHERGLAARSAAATTIQAHVRGGHGRELFGATLEDMMLEFQMEEQAATLGGGSLWGRQDLPLP